MQDQRAYSYKPRTSGIPGTNSLQVANGAEANGAGFSTIPSTTESVLHPVENVEQESPNRTTNGNGQAQQEALEKENAELKSEDLGQVERLNENAKAAALTGDVEHIAHMKPNAQHAATADDDFVPNGVSHQPSGGPDAETRDFLGAGDQAISQSQIEQPSSPNDLLAEHTTDNPHYDVDIAGEVARVQTAVSPKDGETRVEAVTRHLNHTKNVEFKGNAPECPKYEEMTPYIPHPIHEPFPIAMVCREPYGTPNHHSVYNPQNEVWLSALRNAKENVFIQSPTLNAEPLVPAIIEACERGIDVYCYTCLGYNDTVS